MKKNFVAGVIVSLAMVGMFGGLSFAAESATAAKPAVAAVKTEAPVVVKKAVKKHVKKKKKVVKKLAAKKVAAKTEVAPVEVK